MNDHVEALPDTDRKFVDTVMRVFDALDAAIRDRKPYEEVRLQYEDARRALVMVLQSWRGDVVRFEHEQKIERTHTKALIERYTSLVERMQTHIDKLDAENARLSRRSS
jgi:hypothetical protein